MSELEDCLDFCRLLDVPGICSIPPILEKKSRRCATHLRLPRLRIVYIALHQATCDAKIQAYETLDCNSQSFARSLGYPVSYVAAGRQHRLRRTGDSKFVCATRMGKVS